MLVLISPERAGPGAFIDGTPHGLWVLWPQKSDKPALSPLLSLLSGIDWNVQGANLRFEKRDGFWISSGYEWFQRSGYLHSGSARDRPLYVLKEGVSARSLLLSLTSAGPAPATISLEDSWPKGAVICAEANDWDLVAQISTKAAGRVLVIEYPPLGAVNWSKFYLRGTGWQGGLPVSNVCHLPGLIAASEAGRLLTAPRSFTWEEDTSANWGGAGRWLEFDRYYSPLILTACTSFAAFFIGSTIYLFSRQEKAKFALFGVRFVALIPACILLSGSLSPIFGRTLFPTVFGIVLLLLALLASITQGFALLANQDVHPLYGYALIGLVASLSGSPTWSMFSETLGRHLEPFSPQACGIVASYLAGVICLGRGNFFTAWLSRVVAIAAVAAAVFHPWWSPTWALTVLPGVFLLISEGWFRLPWLIAMPFVGLMDATWIRSGVVWAPADLFAHSGDVAKLNLARYAEFFQSPGLVVTAVICLTLAFLLEGYFVKRLRTILTAEFRTRRLFQCALAFAAAGVTEPALLYGALTLFIGAVLAALTDRRWAI